MKYKIVHNIKEGSFTLCSHEKEENGKVILVFEADSYDEASFIKNQFLNFGPYKPFDNCWIAEVGYHVFIDKKQAEAYEIRTVIVIAETEEEATIKIEKEAQKNCLANKEAETREEKWVFQQILSIEIMDFFHTVDLYKGIPIEIKRKRKSIDPKERWENE